MIDFYRGSTAAPAAWRTPSVGVSTWWDLYNRDRSSYNPSTAYTIDHITNENGASK